MRILDRVAVDARKLRPLGSMHCGSYDQAEQQQSICGLVAPIRRSSAARGSRGNATMRIDVARIKAAQRAAQRTHEARMMQLQLQIQ